MNSTRINKSGIVDNVEGSSVKPNQNHSSRRSAIKDKINKQDVKPVTVIVNVSGSDNLNHIKKSGANGKSRHNHPSQEPKFVKTHKDNESNPKEPSSNLSKLNSNVGSLLVDNNQGRARDGNSNTSSNIPINTIHNSPSTVLRTPNNTEIKRGEGPIISTRLIPIEIITPTDQKLIQGVSKSANSQADLTESQSPGSTPKLIVEEHTDDVIYFHFKDKDQDDIRFRVNNLGTYVVINGQSFNGELLNNDGRLIKFKYTNKSGNTWFWTVDQATKGCKGISPRLFTNVEMNSILLNDSILMINKQKLINDY